MAAKVYDPPAAVAAPQWPDDYQDADGQLSHEVWQQRDQRYADELRAWLRGHGYAGELAGELVGWGFADGVAQYMVMRLRPLELMHLPLGDAYQMDAIFMRGLRAADVRQQVKARKQREREQ